MQITRTMGIHISNERNAKQAVRTEENKKVNRGVECQSDPGQELRREGGGRPRPREKREDTRKTFSSEISFGQFGVSDIPPAHTAPSNCGHFIVAKYSNLRNVEIFTCRRTMEIRKIKPRDEHSWR